jgi:MFS family permease
MTSATWRLTLAAATLMALVMGSRSAFGLFVSPINTATGIGLAGLSLAAAIGQLGLGIAQPLVGHLAERFGARRVISCGAWLLAGTTAAIIVVDGVLLLACLLFAGAVAGSAVGSNALLVGELGRRLAERERALALGILGAGGAIGQLLLSPTTQWMIDSQGWMFAMLATAALCLLALPLARAFADHGAAAALPAGAGLPTRALPAAAPADPSDASPLPRALRCGRFWLLAGSFSVCGFHVAFLGMHMPGVIERCGLPASLAATWLAVVAAASLCGSIAVGLGLRRWSAGALVQALYLARALTVAALLALPPTPAVMLGFAAMIGMTYLALVPPMTQLVAQHFGGQRLGSLFGVVMVVHQVGGFAGVWFGGWAAGRDRGDVLFWVVDIALALVALALVRLAGDGGRSHAAFRRCSRWSPVPAS